MQIGGVDLSEAKSGLKILHILTCIGSKGEFGGPLKVALEDLSALSKLGHFAFLYSGIKSDANQPVIEGIQIQTRKVRPISSRVPVSSLFNWQIPIDLFKNIQKSDVVHIHYARDLIPITSVLMAQIIRKKYVIQCHGMIKRDGRKSIRLIDKFFVKPALKNAIAVLYLYPTERFDLSGIFNDANFEYIPNGLSFKTEMKFKPLKERNSTVIFCSRVHPRKRVDKFVQIANSLHSEYPHLKFEIYGADDGAVDSTLTLIDKLNANEFIKYFGPVSVDKMEELLSSIQLLILPSDNEPFPMVIIEALSVGTPVLVTPECGLASKLQPINPNFISDSNSVDDLTAASKRILNALESIDSKAIQVQGGKEFSLDPVIDKLMKVYVK